jgi:Phage integrase, N-terminal SAM-like domain
MANCASTVGIWIVISIERPAKECKISAWLKVNAEPPNRICVARFGGSGIRYRAKGRNGSSKSTNKNDAIRLLNKRRKEIDDRQVTSTDATVNDLLHLYLEDQKRQSRHSYKQADGYVRLHLQPAFGKIRASALTTKMIRAFIDQKQAADYANATINRWLEALRRGYTLGLKELPPLVYVAPEIGDLMLDEDDNVREGFLGHEQYVQLRRIA